jgi:hypothetical protein
VSGAKLFVVIASCWVALLAAVVVAGFLYQAVGIWATILWGLLLAVALALFLRRRAGSEA